MSFGETTRRALLGLAVFACAVAWIILGAAWALDWSRPILVGAVVAAALTTELVFWVGAVVLGWTVFANRARLWKRLTGGSAA